MNSLTPPHSASANHRIYLAIAVALTLHICTFAVANLIPSPKEEVPEKIQLTLSKAGDIQTAPAEPSSQSTVATPNSQEQSQHQDQVIVSENSPRSVAAAAQEEVMDVEQDEPKTTSRQQTPSKPQEGSMARNEGNQGQFKEAGEATHISESTAPPPYIPLLAARISSHAKSYLSASNRADLTETTSVELELTLMDNGALIGATLSQPSTNQLLNQAAHRGALSASPYPPPPENNGKENKFRLTIVFSPERI